MCDDSPGLPIDSRGAEFRTTHWSLVVRAGQDNDKDDGANEALAALCGFDALAT